MSRQKEFLAEAYYYAKQAGLSDHAARVAVAQAALETGYGKSVKGNNYHGIKAGRAYQGQTQWLRTWEEVSGKRKVITDKFRKYASPVDSYRDWAKTVARRWPGVLTAKTFKEAVAALKAGKPGGYATDSQYDNKLRYIDKLISRSGADTYRPLPQEIDIPSYRPSNHERMADGLRSAGLLGLDGRSSEFTAPVGRVERAPLRPVSMPAKSPAPVPAISPKPREAARPPVTMRSSSSGVSVPALAPTPAARLAPTPGDRLAPVPSSAARLAPTPAPRIQPSSAPRLAPVPDSAPPKLNPSPLATAAQQQAAPSPARPDNLMAAGPKGLGGPGGLYLGGPPSTAAAPAPAQPAAPVTPPPALPAAPAPVLAPALAPPRVVQDRPVYQAPPEPRLTPADIYGGMTGSAQATGGNTVSRENPWGPTVVTNQFGAQTAMRGGNQSAYGSIGGPLGSGGILGSFGEDFGPKAKKAGASLAGAALGGGLLGPIGSILGAAIGKELVKPNGGRIGDMIKGVRTIDTSNVPASMGLGAATQFAKAQSGLAFPSAPSIPGASNNPSYSGRSLDQMREISPKAARDIQRGRAGLF